MLNIRRSIRAKLLLASVVVEALMLALLVSNSVRLIEHHLSEQLDARVQAVELAYKTAVAVPLASRDYATLRDILDGWRKASDITYLAVTDPDGRILSSSGWSADDALPLVNRSDGHIRHVRFPVDYLGQVYGHIHYGMSTTFMDKASAQLLWQSGLIALSEVALSVFLLSIIGYLLTRHLIKLAEASINVAEGHYEERMEISGEDEVAVLARNFNTMTDAVKSRIADLSYQANHDSLTGLFNRRAFETHLEAVLKADDLAENPATLLYLDLDQFKVVNDTCGHAAGDELLIRLTQMIEDRFPYGFISRLGGDEFGIVMRDCSPQETVRRARQLIDEICAFPFFSDGRSFRLGASIGVVRSGPDMKNVTDLLIAADTACYAAKERGRNRVEIYTPTDEWFQQRNEDFRTMPQLTRAIAEGRFMLFHQRQEPLKPGLPITAEVLLRLSDPLGKINSPSRFIATAERYNLMPYIDRWVVENVCRYMSDWQKSGQPFPFSHLAVNVSGASLSLNDFPAFVRQQIEKHGINPAKLCFEITESCAVANLDQALDFIEQMRAIGATLALDDFGSGLSSFGYLKRFKVDFLKIDGMFVKNVDQDARDQAVVEAIVQLARAHGLITVAEFVCNPEVERVVQDIGVDYAQGYVRHVPEPLPKLPTL
ncbi:MAG: diguanylate cyclase/phosphodiesterase [Proteobacteria bacterium]|nr:diguanylate cyclase/phosphodiesterase [Pseudomonadota bacterium]